MASSAADGFWDGAADHRREDDEDSVWSAWSRTVDHWTIGACFALFAIGVVLAFAASPPLVERQNANLGAGLHAFHYAWRHMLFGLPAFLALFAMSFLGARAVRRVGLLLTASCLVGLILLESFGVSHSKEATRWFSLAGFSLQPTEFLKPGLVVVCAAMLSALSHHEPAIRRGGAIAAAVTVAFAATLLIRQPDYSQTALILTVCGVMYFVAGGSLRTLAVIGGVTLVAAAVAYAFEPHFANRIDAFLDEGEALNYQIRKAQAAIANGGWLGVGVGEGVAKATLPDAHADFILAVAAEEYGFKLVLPIIALFAVAPIRAVARAADSEDPFVRVAVTGLAFLLGLQAFVNIAVTAQLLPVTGVTLPFISYGGSSMVATGIAVGLMLALTRRGPRDLSLDLDDDR